MVIWSTIYLPVTGIEPIFLTYSKPHVSIMLALSPVRTLTVIPVKGPWALPQTISVLMTCYLPIVEEFFEIKSFITNFTCLKPIQRSWEIASSSQNPLFVPIKERKKSILETLWKYSMYSWNYKQVKSPARLLHIFCQLNLWCQISLSDLAWLWSHRNKAV